MYVLDLHVLYATREFRGDPHKILIYKTHEIHNLCLRERNRTCFFINLFNNSSESGANQFHALDNDIYMMFH